MTTDVRTTASSWGVTASAYEKFSEHFGDALYHCVQRLDPKKDEKIRLLAESSG